MIKSLYEPFRHWSAKGSVYVYSDTHFGDEYMAWARGFDSAELFDNYQLENINSRVRTNDTLVLLGDVGDVEKMLQINRCKRVLIMGNHDAGKTKYESYFNEVYEGPLMIAPKIMLSHEPCGGPWFNIHGHEHDGTRDYNPFSKTGFNVAGEHVNYYPISLGDLIKEGFVGKVDDIHRLVIDEAAERARKRGYKLGER